MGERLKNSDKQILLVTESANSKALKAVTGLDKNGKLKTANPDSANLTDFLNIDKNGNALENFFKKFLEQSKNPSHTGFFLLTEKVLNKIIKIQPIDEKMLEPYRVDPKQYLFAIQEQQGKTQKQEQGEPSAQKTVFQPIDESKINWQQAASMGLDRQSLEEAGQLKAMLYGHKSPALNNITLSVDGAAFETQARLSLKEMPDGTYNIQPHCFQKSPELDKPFLGAILTDKDKENLLQSGNAGRVIELEPMPGEKVSALVSLDKITNRLEAVPLEKLNLPQSLKGVELTSEQLKDLKEGKQVLVEGMTSKKSMETDNPKKFDAYIQFNAAKGNFDFNYDGLNGKRQENKQEETQDGQQNVRIPTKLLGVELPQKQQDELRADKTIYVKGMVKDGQGQPFNAYVKVNHEEGKLDFYKWNPDKTQKQDAGNKAQTQDGGKNIRIPQKLLGVELPQKQQDELRADKTIYVKGMVKDGQGQPFNAYVKVNHEKGKLKFYKFNPDKAQKQGAEVKPAAESKTQVAVNTEGKTNEATKGIKEPLKQGQNKPNESQEKKIKKNKGVKI